MKIQPVSIANFLVIGFAFSVPMGCSPAEHSSADTLAATAVSSTPAAVVQQADSVASPAATSTGGTASRSAPAKGRAPVATKVVPPNPNVRVAPPPARDTSSIIGYDSIIRVPIRTVPRATSTPVR